MARIPDAKLERLKTEVRVERQVEAAGIELTRTGKDRLSASPPSASSGLPPPALTTARYASPGDGSLALVS